MGDSLYKAFWNSSNKLRQSLQDTGVLNDKSVNCWSNGKWYSLIRRWSWKKTHFILHIFVFAYFRNPYSLREVFHDVAPAVADISNSAQMRTACCAVKEPTDFAVSGATCGETTLEFHLLRWVAGDIQYGSLN